MIQPKGTASENVSNGSQPRAVIHKKILDTAKSNPDSSFQTISEMVSGASKELVERVLEEYGDPAESDLQPEEVVTTDKTNTQDHSGNTSESIMYEDTEATTHGKNGDSAVEISNEAVVTSGGETDGTAQEGEPSGSSSAKSESTTNQATPVSELTDKQKETFWAVKQNPAATQKEIAAQLDVSRATISKRVNNVQGFSWKTRRSFVETLFSDAEDSALSDELSSTSSDTTVDNLETRISALEKQLQTHEGSDDESLLTPELAHKVVHACIDADHVSKDEELELLRELM